MTWEQERRLTAVVKQDELYQQLLLECEARAADYERIMESLSENDRERLEQYISACEEMEYRRGCLACEMGIQDGARIRSEITR